jgi:hypothetical protein
MWPTTKGCLSVGLGTLRGHPHGPKKAHVASLEGLAFAHPSRSLRLISFGLLRLLLGGKPLNPKRTVRLVSQLFAP